MGRRGLPHVLSALHVAGSCVGLGSGRDPGLLALGLEGLPGREGLEGRLPSPLPTSHRWRLVSLQSSNVGLVPSLTLSRSTQRPRSALGRHLLPSLNFQRKSLSLSHLAIRSSEPSLTWPRTVMHLSLSFFQVMNLYVISSSLSPAIAMSDHCRSLLLVQPRMTISLSPLNATQRDRSATE